MLNMKGLVIFWCILKKGKVEAPFGVGAQQATKVAYWRSVKKSIVRAQATNVAY